MAISSIAKRRCESDVATRLSTVPTASSGNSASSSRMAARTPEITAAGSPSVRTAKYMALNGICAAGSYTAARPLASSPSSRTSPAMPTISAGLEPLPIWIRWPIGFSLG